MALIDLPIDPPDEPDMEKLEKFAIALAHDRLSLPHGVEDPDAEVTFTGPKTALVTMELTLVVELP